jgi:hypothetical protein
MISYWLNPSEVKDSTFIPKYYSPEADALLGELSRDFNMHTIGSLIDLGVLSISAGHEIGKNSYGTGDIPFVRTSDIPNWEVKVSSKQGVSKDIYETFSAKQDIQPGDVLLVRDGTYLVGNTAVVMPEDGDLLYQSHLLRIRVNENSIGLDPYLLFASMNSPVTQARVRALQFTADIIDTLGKRVDELPVLIHRDEERRLSISRTVRDLLETRARYKRVIAGFGAAMEQVLLDDDEAQLRALIEGSGTGAVVHHRSPAVSSEMGQFQAYWRSPGEISGGIYLPTYYDVAIDRELSMMSETCEFVTVGELVKAGDLEISSGHEVGKMAYGTGGFPFLRTTDFSNWEIIHNPKQGVSENIYNSYRQKQELRELDVLLVRDGTYLVGSSCIVLGDDANSLYCGGLLRVRSVSSRIDPFLLFGLLNSFIVKRQFRTKQFTRDVIDTLGQRVLEVVIPIPKSRELGVLISSLVERVVRERVEARVHLRMICDLYGPRS